MRPDVKKKLLIGIGLGIGLILVSWLFFLFSSKQNEYVPNEIVMIDNAKEYQSGLNETVFLSIGKAAYATLQENGITGKSVYHGIVRNDSFEKVTDGVSFILDMPEEKISWRVAQGIDDDGNDHSDATVSCISQEEAIYELIDGCKDVNNGFATKEQQAFLEMTKILPLMGPTYSVTYRTTNENELGYILDVIVYGETGRADVSAAFQSLGYSIDSYPTNYTVR